MAHRALQTHNIMPDQFMALSPQAQAFIAASDIVEGNEQKKQLAKLRRRR